MKYFRIAQLALVVGAAACDKPAPPPSDSATAAPPTPAPAVTPAADAAPATFRVRMETSKGPIVLELQRDWAPNGVDRFFQLVEEGYFNDARFFRVVPKFIVQFGMNGDPATYAKWKDQRITDDPVKQTNARGTVTFATSGPNTRTTQLFINLGDNAGLDQQGFSPIGTIVEGMSVVDRLFSGYGDPPQDQQGNIATGGNAYLTQNYPKLDFIRTAKVLK
jgi:peptidyl-prolyl cis-trans isomerase A (cyclophilin A)